MTYNNGLTFTNLTPQTSAHESVVDQMDQLRSRRSLRASSAAGRTAGIASPMAMSTGVFSSLVIRLERIAPRGSLRSRQAMEIRPTPGKPADRRSSAQSTLSTRRMAPVASTQTAIHRAQPACPRRNRRDRLGPGAREPVPVQLILRTSRVFRLPAQTVLSTGCPAAASAF